MAEDHLVYCGECGSIAQAGFAEADKIDRAHMGEIERGEITVTIVTALKVAQALGLTLAGLFSELERRQDRSG